MSVCQNVIDDNTLHYKNHLTLNVWNTIYIWRTFSTVKQFLNLAYLTLSDRPLSLKACVNSKGRLLSFDWPETSSSFIWLAMCIWALSNAWGRSDQPNQSDSLLTSGKQLFVILTNSDLQKINLTIWWRIYSDISIQALESWDNKRGFLQPNTLNINTYYGNQNASSTVTITFVVKRWSYKR